MVQHLLELPARDLEINTGVGSVFFIGNATVIIRCAGFTILTDPNFIHMHEKVPLGYGLEAERLTNPALEIAELPPIDFVVLSHFHGDHFDQVAERDLPRDVPIFTPPEAARKLEERGFTACYPLDTWATASITRGKDIVRVTATPGWHGPWLVGKLLPTVMGTVLDFEHAGQTVTPRMYISGDTLIIAELREIPRRCGPIDLALLHLGGTKALGLTVTMDDKQGLEMMRIIKPDMAIPIHYNDYDVFKSPLSDFQERIRESGLADHVHYLAHGETYKFPIASELDSARS